MSKVILNAEKREVIGKKVNQLRREGKLPAVIYGSNMDPMAITLNLREASKILANATSSTLVAIKVNGKEHTALVRERQKNYILNQLIHVDFLAVSMDEKIKAEVPVITEGVSPAVKDFNAVLVTGISTVEVSAYPQDLPENFVIDLSEIKNLGDTITVGDLKVSENVEILSSLEDIVISATGMSVSAEEAAEGEELEGSDSEPEVIEKGKKDDDFED